MRGFASTSAEESSDPGLSEARAGGADENLFGWALGDHEARNYRVVVTAAHPGACGNVDESLIILCT